MKLLELFRNSFLNNRVSKNLRNLIGFFPSYFNINLKKKNQSISDAFIWRTDNGFKTIFKYTDILKLFYNNNESEVEIEFFNRNNSLIKKITLSNINISNQILIDKYFLDGIEDYGTFYIFHKSKKKINSIIRNSCYTGYSYLDNLPSFVHGNLLTKIKDFSGKNIEEGIGAKSFFKNKVYTLQNSFKNRSFELAFINPCKSTINFQISKSNYKINKGETLIIKFKDLDFIQIVSNSYLLRPIVFELEKDYLDVYHG